ncbi:phytoene desaturase family protein [Candidatus Margulisiibacteriota bacterium]
MADDLCERLVEKGGTVLLSKEVKRINVKNKKIESVFLDDKTVIASDFIVSNADSYLTFMTLIGPEHLSGELVNNLQSMEISQPSFSLYLGVNYQNLQDYEGCYFFENNVNKGIAVTISTKYDQTLAPAGKNCLVVSTSFPYEFDKVKDWAQCKNELELTTLSRLEQVIPGIKNSIEVKESATPMTYYRYTLNKMGSSFGWSSIPSQFWTRRFSNKTPVKGLYLAGHWTQPGSGISSVVASGRIAANLLLSENKEK